MLNSVNNLNMPTLPECLALEPIMLGNLKYPRPGELRRVLGVPNTSEDRFFGVSHPKARDPVGNELKYIKETVEDVSKEARDRAKLIHESMSKLDKYRETLTSKKRQRSDVLPGAQILKAGIRIQQISNNIAPHRLENRVKSGPLNKRIRTSVADQRTDNRQQMFPDKDGNIIPVIGGISGRVEEKTRRLLSCGEALDQKIKKKRSVGAVGNRVLNGDRDLKRPAPPKLAADSKLRSCDSNSFRVKSSAGVNGINKSDGSFEPTIADSRPIPKTEFERESGSLSRDRVAVLDQSILVKGSEKPNIQQNNLVGSLQTVVKGKVSKAQRIGSVMALDSTPGVHPSSGAFQGSEQPTVVLNVSGINQKRQTSGGSVIHLMTQWGGQRPHKNSRTRRTNLVSPVSNNAETQISSQVFAASEFGARTSMIGTAGSTLPGNVDNDSPRIISETKNFSSLFGLSESDESGAGEKEAVLTTQKARAFALPVKKNNKISSKESGDGLKRKGRGRGSLVPPGVPPMKEKSKKVLALDPLQDVTPISDKNKRIGKMGRPSSKKLKDRKGLPRLRPTLSNGSSDFTGESDDDHEELYLAAKSARNASNLACSSVFWKKMDYIFASVLSEDASYLNQQLSAAEEMCDSLSQMFGDEFQILGLDEGFSSYGKRQDDQSEKLSRKKFDKVTPLYQRVLSALIEEDESDEFYHHSEGKNTPLQSFSDDSHCSSNQFDTEPKDKDRTENEVESNLGFQTHRNCFVDRISFNGNAGTNTLRSPSMSTTLHTNERWQGYDEFLPADSRHACEINSNHFGQLQAREFDVPESPPSDCQYQLMSINDKVLLELQSIGLFPEPLPDLAEVGEIISGNIIELEEELHKQVSSKKNHLGKVDMVIQKVRDLERRNIEQVAMDKLVEMAYRKRMACRGGNSSKSVVRKVSKQVAMAFVKRTLARCQKFEETGKSCFIDPALQEVLFSEPQSQNISKPVDFVGSGTATNTCNEAFYQAGVVSYALEKYGSPGDYIDNKGSPALNRGKKRDAPIDEFFGSASSRVDSGLDNGLGSPTERKTNAKSKQKITDQSASGNDKKSGYSSPKEAEEQEAADFGNNLPLKELDSLEDFGGNQDLASWLNFEEDDPLDHDLIGLQIPTDDLSELNMLI